MRICPDGHEGPNCPCNFCRGMKTALGEMARVDHLAHMRVPGRCLDPVRLKRIQTGPFCDNCGYGSATPCVHHQCHEEKAFCAEHGTPCVACNQMYCERHAVESLDVNQMCENCAYVAALPADKLCPACKAEEIGETIPTCLACHWRTATDGMKKTAESFARLAEELTGRTA